MMITVDKKRQRDNILSHSLYAFFPFFFFFFADNFYHVLFWFCNFLKIVLINLTIDKVLFTRKHCCKVRVIYWPYKEILLMILNSIEVIELRELHNSRSAYGFWSIQFIWNFDNLKLNSHRYHRVKFIWKITSK